MADKVRFDLSDLRGFLLLTAVFSGKQNTFTIFTGDLTSHDNDNQLSRSYVEYVESAVYSIFKAYLAGPVYAVLVCTPHLSE